MYDDLYRHANDNVSEWYNGIFPSKLKSNYKGEWDSKTKYVSPHVVKYDGNYYQYLCSASDKFSVVTGYDDSGNEIKQTYNAADYLVGKTPEEAASDVNGYKYIQILDVYNPYDYGYITIKAFRDSLFSHVGITQESVSLINDSVKITKTIDSDEIKFSDCVKAICQINAVFGHISEIGVFQYISLGGSTEDYSGNYKATSTTYEEFSTKAIDSVRLYDNAGNVASIYGSGQNHWNIVNNFLIYNLSSSVLNGIATRLYSAVSGIRYTPYSLQALVSLFPVRMGSALSFTTHTGTYVASYVLKDKLSGSQIVNQTISANGTETRNNNSSTLESLNQLNSRTKAIVEKIYQKLTADNAEIKTISGDLANYKVIVTDEIQAISGEFEYVRSDYGEFKDFTTQNFTAIDGRINNLSGDLASFKVGEFEELRSKQADFETATAENFSAQEAEIKSLSGDFTSFKTGEFETLRSKQAEFETTTTQSITAVTGQIDTLSGDLATYKTVVAENFESTNAQITSISGDYSNFKEQTAEKFTAAYADIEHLKTTTLELDELIADKASISDLNAVNAEITNLKATQITSEYLDSNFAKIDLANIEKGCITTAMLGTAVVGTTQIADGSITDAKIVELTANKINAGTLSVERLEIRGSSNSIVYALNDITGALQSQNVDTLNGEILTPRSITADRIVANAITANEIAAKTITANEIAAYSITANEIAAETITSREIASKTITADNIAANTITSTEINVTDLFAQDITATGTIRGVTLNAATGEFSGNVTADSGSVGGWDVLKKCMYSQEIASGTTVVLQNMFAGLFSVSTVTGNNCTAQIKNYKIIVKPTTSGSASLSIRIPIKKGSFKLILQSGYVGSGKADDFIQGGYTYIDSDGAEVDYFITFTKGDALSGTTSTYSFDLEISEETDCFNVFYSMPSAVSGETYEFSVYASMNGNDYTDEYNETIVGIPATAVMAIKKENSGTTEIPFYIDQSGSVYSKCIYEDGTALSSKYAAKSHDHTNMMHLVSANGYYGMALGDNSASNWIRTTGAGIIPYQSGGSTDGHCGLGTSSWYFASGYIQNIYGTNIYEGGTALSSKYAALSHTHSYLPLSGGTLTGELRSTAGIQFRMVAGNYGSFFRNDGSSTYLLLTNSGDQYGSFNSLRPFCVSNSTGKVSIGNGLGVSGGINVTSGNIVMSGGGILPYDGNLYIKAAGYDGYLSNYLSARLSTSGGEVNGRISSLHGTYTATASSRFGNQALEIRENDYVGNAQSDIGYAPAIGFHWSGRVAASLLMHSDGSFRLLNQAYNDFCDLCIRNLYLGGMPYGQLSIDSSYNVYLKSKGNGFVYLGDSRFVVPPSGNAAHRAVTDNAYTCGHASYRYTYVYAVSGTIQTSDEREKDILSGLSPADLSDYFMSLKPIAYRWNSGNDRRIHFGLGAQTAKASLEQSGYNPDDFSLIQHDVLEEVSATGLTDRYGMDYQGYNILTMAQTQKNTRDIMVINDWQRGVDVELACVSAKQESLEYRIASLQEQLAEANARIAEQAAEIEKLKAAS